VDESLLTMELRLPGERRVEPYDRESIQFVKLKWEGLTVSQLFSGMLGMSGPFLSAAIAEGRILVNGERVEAGTVLREHDELRSLLPVWEPPVVDTPPGVLFDGEALVPGREAPAMMVASSKPVTIPVHPTGPFNHNTLCEILRREHKLTASNGASSLKPVHRLDRLTSGLVLLARDSASAGALARLVGGGGVAKVYVARARGNFMEFSATTVRAASSTGSVVMPAPTGSREACLHPEGVWFGGIDAGALAAAREAEPMDVASTTESITITADSTGQVAVDCSSLSVHDPDVCASVLRRVLSSGGDPSVTIANASVRATLVTGPLDDDPELHLPRVLPTGKPSATLLVPLAYDADSDTTLIVARIFTGRTHQIRAHLRHLGFPVCGDPLHGIPYPPRPAERDKGSLIAPDEDATEESFEAGQSAWDIASARRIVAPLRHKKGIALHSFALVLLPDGLCLLDTLGLPSWVGGATPALVATVAMACMIRIGSP
jgi:23S rRNA-/tRNA-specific pseudouridylate synthase